MKTTGFTLIELLAVIVILSIIALIATPIILGIINDAKIKSKERSMENYIDAVEQAIVKENLIREFNPSKCNIQSDGNLLCDSEQKKVVVTVDGTKPSDGILIIRNNKIDTSEIHFEDTAVIKTSDGTTTQKSVKEIKKYNNGEVVYFNVTTGEKCTNYTESQSAIGVKEGCMKFYAFNDNEDSYTVNLLLDHNTTATVAWNSSGSNATGPITLLAQLKTDTDSWKGTITPNNYTMDQRGQVSNAYYKIDYSEYKTRLITAQEIAQITGADVELNWNEITTSVNSFYFDSLASTASETCTSGNTSGCKYGWLYDRISFYCTTYGCLNNSESTPFIWGYWTASSNYRDNLFAFCIYGSGNLGIDSVGGSYVGVRPVIEVLKSKL